MDSAAPGRSVLVADDEPQLLRLLERVLERAGYPVVTARDAEQAIRAIGAHPREIAVAVLDGAMPPEGAGPVLEAIARCNGRVGVILTSGEALEGSLRERLRAQRGIFLHKPFPPRELLRAVQACLTPEAP